MQTYNDTQYLDPFTSYLMCPICGQKMKSDTSMVNGAIGESSIVCPDGHYYEEFLYGFTRTRVCGVSWSDCWGTTGQDIRNQCDAINLVIELNKLPSLGTTLQMMSPDEFIRMI